MPSITMTKDQLIARLEEQLPIAKKHDAAVLVEHRKAEAAALALFKEKCRAALKWDYPTMKKAGGVSLNYNQSPQCPKAIAIRFQRAIEHLTLSSQKRFVMSDSNIFHDLVTWSPVPQPKSEVC